LVKQFVPSRAATKPRRFSPAEADLQVKYQLTEGAGVTAGYELCGSAAFALAPGRIQGNVDDSTSGEARSASTAVERALQGGTGRAGIFVLGV